MASTVACHIVLTQQCAAAHMMSLLRWSVYSSLHWYEEENRCLVGILRFYKMLLDVLPTILHSCCCEDSLPSVQLNKQLKQHTCDMPTHRSHPAGAVRLLHWLVRQHHCGMWPTSKVWWPDPNSHCSPRTTGQAQAALTISAEAIKCFLPGNATMHCGARREFTSENKTHHKLQLLY